MQYTAIIPQVTSLRFPPPHASVNSGSRHLPGPGSSAPSNERDRVAAEGGVGVLPHPQVASGARRGSSLRGQIPERQRRAPDAVVEQRSRADTGDDRSPRLSQVHQLLRQSYIGADPRGTRAAAAASDSAAARQ